MSDQSQDKPHFPGFKKPSKSEFYRIKRSDFVSSRYANYQKKLAFLKQSGAEAAFHLSDLDKTYEGHDKPLKDIVICDACNEDITDDTIISYHSSRIYHEKCAKNYGCALPPEEPPMSYDNVVSLYVED